MVSGCLPPLSGFGATGLERTALLASLHVVRGALAGIRGSSSCWLVCLGSAFSVLVLFRGWCRVVLGLLQGRPFGGLNSVSLGALCAVRRSFSQVKARFCVLRSCVGSVDVRFALASARPGKSEGCHCSRESGRYGSCLRVPSRNRKLSLQRREAK